LDELGLNVKLVAAVSYELFKLQPESYQKQIISDEDWLNSTVITNAARRNMHDWLYTKVAEEYAMSSDWDNRWRTGGSVEELCEEAHISPNWLLKGIEKFAKDLDVRLAKLKK
jgi:transketolase